MSSWKDFVRRWRQVDLVRLGIPVSTVAEWRAGKKEPKGWQRTAAEFWIPAALGAPAKKRARAVKSAKRAGG